MLQPSSPAVWKDSSQQQTVAFKGREHSPSLKPLSIIAPMSFVTGNLRKNCTARCSQHMIKNKSVCAQTGPPLCVIAVRPILIHPHIFNSAAGISKDTFIHCEWPQPYSRSERRNINPSGTFVFCCYCFFNPVCLFLWLWTAEDHFHIHMMKWTRGWRRSFSVDLCLFKPSLSFRAVKHRKNTPQTIIHHRTSDDLKWYHCHSLTVWLQWFMAALGILFLINDVKSDVQFLADCCHISLFSPPQGKRWGTLCQRIPGWDHWVWPGTASEGGELWCWPMASGYDTWRSMFEHSLPHARQTTVWQGHF